MISKQHIEIECSQLTKTGQDVCGDDFKVRRIDEESRYIAVLSDGLGSGIKANLLANMTTTMALRFVRQNMDIVQSSEIIMDCLPVCDVRKISYSTFTVADIFKNGETRIIEMDNPGYIHLRNCVDVKHDKQAQVSHNWPDRKLLVSRFQAYPEDRLIFFSDGVTQAGLGYPGHKFGWKREGCLEFITTLLKRDPDISARDLAQSIVLEAVAKNPERKCADDTSCCVIYFRVPRKLLLLTGPPFRHEDDSEFARRFNIFEGKKIISGGTTASIIGRELNLELKPHLPAPGEWLPAPSEMDGADLVTEGILTLTETVKHLESGSTNPPPAVKRLCNLLTESDEVHFLVGTKVNEAHHDPTLPVDLEVRRHIIRRLSNILEEKMLKNTIIEYI